MVFDCQCCTSEGPQRVPFGEDSVHAEGRHWISSWLKMRNRGSHLHASCSNRRTSSIKQQAVSHTLWEGRGKEQGFLIHGSVTTQLRSAGN